MRTGKPAEQNIISTGTFQKRSAGFFCSGTPNHDKLGRNGNFGALKLGRNGNFGALKLGRNGNFGVFKLGRNGNFDILTFGRNGCR